MADIPVNLYSYSAIYEYRTWILLLILMMELYLLGDVLLRRKKIYFFYAVLFPILFCFVNIGCTWCGWHYRMKLRDLHATEAGLVNIDRMPPHIRAEYAKHDYHPRFRDLTAQTLGMIVLTPLLFGLQVFIWILYSQFGRRTKK